VLASRERFLSGLEKMQPLNGEQRAALDREWANYLLARGWLSERVGEFSKARGYYGRAIRKAPFRLRAYTRWLRTLAR
jgi:hypothetical protein